MSLLSDIGSGISKAGTAARLAAPYLNVIPGIGGLAGDLSGYLGQEHGVSELFSYPGKANGAAAPQSQSQVSQVKDDTGNQSTNGYSSGSSSGGSATTYNPAQLSAIDAEIARLGNQEAVGRGNINNSYQSAFDTLTNGQAQAQAQYNTTLGRTQQDNVDAKNTIDSGVRTGLSGLQRLLGAAGAGNSSAARVLAPYAAGLEGNTQRQEVNKTYGRNVDDLNTGFADTQNQYKDKFGALDADKNNKLNTLLSGLANTRASLLSSRSAIAGGGDHQAEINALHNQIDSLGNVQTYDPGTVNYTPAAQAAYTYNATGAPVTNPNDAGLASNVGPYYNLLTDKDKKQTAGV